MPRPELRCFLAHAKDDPDEWIDACCNAVRLRLSWTYGEAVVVISGRDDFRRINGASAPRGKAGHRPWNEWINLVALGTTASGEPRYHGIVVPACVVDQGVGKATAKIVELALDAKKPCLYYETGTERFQPIRGVEQAGDDWKSGWRLQLFYVPARLDGCGKLH